MEQDTAVEVTLNLLDAKGSQNYTVAARWSVKLALGCEALVCNYR